MTDEEWDNVKAYLMEAWPKTHNPLHSRWMTSLLTEDASDVHEAIDFHFDKQQTQYGPSLEEVLATVERIRKRRSEHAQRKAAPMMFAPGVQTKERDKNLAKNALRLCRMLVLKEIASAEAVAYCREVLSKEDVDNSGEYYTMAQSIESGAAEARKAAEKYAHMREVKKRRPRFAPEPKDVDEDKLKEWLKQRREKECSG